MPSPVDDTLRDLGGVLTYTDLQETVLGLLESIPEIGRWVEEHRGVPESRIQAVAEDGFGAWLTKNLGLSDQSTPLVVWFWNRSIRTAVRMRDIIFQCLIREVRGEDYSVWTELPVGGSGW